MAYLNIITHSENASTKTALKTSLAGNDVHKACGEILSANVMQIITKGFSLFNSIESSTNQDYRETVSDDTNINKESEDLKLYYTLITQLDKNNVKKLKELYQGTDNTTIKKGYESIIKMPKYKELFT